MSIESGGIPALHTGAGEDPLQRPMGLVTTGGRGIPPPKIYQALRLVVLDVDGVLNTGRISLNGRGEETGFFDVRDGTGLTFLRLAGIGVAIMSGRENPVAVAWARDMGLPANRVVLGAQRKLPAFTQMLRNCGVNLEEAVYAGDDIIDVPVLEQAALAACPADAHQLIAGYCHVQTRAGGGRGAVRQLCEHLLMQRQDGTWEKVIRKYWGLEDPAVAVK